MDDFLSFIEWEDLQQNEHLIRGEFYIDGKLQENLKTISISRGGSYKLQGKLICVGELDLNVGDEQVAGSIANPHRIEVRSEEMCRYILFPCYFGGKQRSFNVNDNMTKLEIDIITFQVDKLFSEDNPYQLTEWYINGPLDLQFSRSTEIESSQKYTINRNDYQQNIEFEIPGYSKMSFDYVLVNLPNYKFIIKYVPKDYDPDWSHKIGIEYRKEFGLIPDEDEREAIAEIVSFIFGRHLLNTGYTTYDEKNFIIKQRSINPWGNNQEHICSNASHSPMEIDRENIENILNYLVPQYLKSRDSYNLSNVLWRYWIADDLPLGTNLPLFANGIEILSAAWFSTNNSKTKGVYIEKKKFDKLMSENFEKIQNSLEGIEYADRILNRIKNSYNMGANEKLDFFFNEIDLPVGEVEKKAIRERNRMIYSSYTNDDDDKSILLSKYTKVYRTFFHRVILKILKYENMYIDYSVSGFPNKNINVVVGEEN
ncbi:hypothetical protein V2U94_04280 [Paenibacillus polymyxa]|uniref:hypothetical protein n=1 Tax=Paenibacillus polymyxa TaxID=1406 RepID=UPI002ED586C0|nr:hypothetical protein [Paenibacillus polymyxa]